MIDLKQQLLEYVSKDTMYGGNQASGAYVFSPTESLPTPLVPSSNASCTLWKGPLVSQLEQAVSAYGATSFVFTHPAPATAANAATSTKSPGTKSPGSGTGLQLADFIEMRYRIGPLPPNREVVTRLTTATQPGSSKGSVMYSGMPSTVCPQLCLPSTVCPQLTLSLMYSQILTERMCCAVRQLPTRWSAASSPPWCRARTSPILSAAQHLRLSPSDPMA